MKNAVASCVRVRLAAIAIALTAARAVAQPAPAPPPVPPGGAVPPIPPGGAVPPIPPGDPVPTIPPGGSIAPVTPAAATAPVAEAAPKPDQRARAEQLDEEITELLQIPQTPAAFALGISPERVAYPGDLRDAAAHLVTLLEPGATVAPGAAIEVALLRSLSSEMTLEEWQARATWWRHVIDSFRISLAAGSDPEARGVSAAPTLLAGGMRLSLIDERDYRNNSQFVHQTRVALAKCFPEKAVPMGSGGANYTEVSLPADCEDLDRTLRDLRTKYLTTGNRLELASAVVAADRGGTASADWRSTRLWAAYEYAFPTPSIGAAADLAWRDDATGEAVRDFRLGLRVAANTQPASFSLSGAYARLAGGSSDPHNGADVATALGVRLGKWLLVQGGLQLSHDFDAEATRATALISLSSATGETWFSHTIDYSSPGQSR